MLFQAQVDLNQLRATPNLANFPIQNRLPNSPVKAAYFQFELFENDVGRLQSAIAMKKSQIIEQVSFYKKSMEFISQLTQPFGFL